jgi:uncharacterized membrane protein
MSAPVKVCTEASAQAEPETMRERLLRRNSMNYTENHRLLASPAYRIVSISLLTAVTAVFTLVVRIPIAPTRGYINLGDVAIFFTAFTFGPVTALVSGGLGTAVADLLSGYAQWAPISLIIHGVQGFLAGLIVRTYLVKVSRDQSGTEAEVTFIQQRRRTLVVTGIAGIVGTVIMTGLYFLAGASLYGFGPALVEVPGNIIQCVVGFTGGFLLNRTVVRAYPPVRDLFL